MTMIANFLPSEFIALNLYAARPMKLSNNYVRLNKNKKVYIQFQDKMDRVKRIWYLSPMRAAKVQASLRIRAVSPEPSLLAHTSSESRGTFRQKARSLAPLNGCACAVKVCHDGMLEDTNSLDGAQMEDTLQVFKVVSPRCVRNGDYFFKR